MIQSLAQYFRGWIDHPHLARRIVIAVLSTMMMGVCILAFEWLEVGTDPFSCVCLGVRDLTGIDLQVLQPIVHGVTLCIVLFVARDMFGFGSLANIFLVGITHDLIWIHLMNRTMPPMPETGMRILLFIPFAALFLVSVSFYVAADLGTSPYDAAPIIISRKLWQDPPRISSTVVRIAWDAFFTLVGVLLAGPFGAVTMACVLFLGPLITWISGKLKRFIE